MFRHIFGVTGTLDTERLPPQMHEILKEYAGIEVFTYCPSMFPESKRDWQPKNQAYVKVAKNVDEHYHFIVDEIDRRLLATTDMKDKRSVLVFFRTRQEVVAFLNSPYFAKHKAKASVLSELTAASAANRDHIITSATRQGQITLATRVFGRGTDFKINDNRMEIAGGLHVISTFFSRDISEEAQMMGRSARQGDHGSFSLVMLSKIEDMDVTADVVEGWEPAEVHANLSQLRAQASAAEVQALRDMAKERIDEHKILSRSLTEFTRGR